MLKKLFKKYLKFICAFALIYILKHYIIIPNFEFYYKVLFLLIMNAQ